MARVREAAIRIAVGAGPGHVMWVVARRALQAVSIGVAAGALLLAGVAPAVQDLLTDLRVSDPRFALGALAVVLLATGSALVLPSYCVRRVQPAVLLRHD